MSAKTIFKMITAGAWESIILIAYATLANVGLVYSIAFAVVGALFSFAYPRRAILVCCIVFGGAALLEILQTLTLDRHGTLVDELEKMAGGVSGIFIAKGILLGPAEAGFIKRSRICATPHAGKLGHRP